MSTSASVENSGNTPNPVLPKPCIPRRGFGKKLGLAAAALGSLDLGLGIGIGAFAEGHDSSLATGFNILRTDTLLRGVKEADATFGALLAIGLSYPDVDLEHSDIWQLIVQTINTGKADFTKLFPDNGPDTQLGLRYAKAVDRATSLTAWVHFLTEDVGLSKDDVRTYVIANSFTKHLQPRATSQKALASFVIVDMLTSASAGINNSFLQEDGLAEKTRSVLTQRMNGLAQQYNIPDNAPNKTNLVFMALFKDALIS